jgi:hypothetical protein
MAAPGRKLHHHVHHSKEHVRHLRENLVHRIAAPPKARQRVAEEYGDEEDLQHVAVARKCVAEGARNDVQDELGSALCCCGVSVSGYG